MNKEEFLEMKAEFALIIYNYEKFLKDCILIDYRYNSLFYSVLEKLRYYEIENNLLAKCCQIKAENLDEDAEDIIHKVKETFKAEKMQFVRKHQIAVNVVSHNEKEMNPDLTQEFEDLYCKFISENHPVVKALVSEEEKQAYEQLKIYYYENNYMGFKQAYEERKSLFTNPEYQEDIYNKISSYYYDIRRNIGNDFNKRQANYPFTKRNVFQDDMSIAYEEGELKSNLTKLQRDNKKLHEEFEKFYSYDIKLFDEQK